MKKLVKINTGADLKCHAVSCIKKKNAMENIPTSFTATAIYPGEYIPLPETQGLVSKPRGVIAHTAGPLLAVNLEEKEDAVEIEMLIPGSGREDILVLIKRNDLSVIVRAQSVDGDYLKLHEFNEACVQRNISLPVNADTEFVKAYYRQGKLRIYIPKHAQPLKPETQRNVAIY
jgi:HSP20 family molecular chaperone IbpA